MNKIRITAYGTAPADQFTAHPDNPKFHPQAQRDALRGALAEIGWIAPVIVNKNTGYLIDGHERVMTALLTGEDVPYVEVDLNEDEEAYALVTLDPIGYMAQHDREKLAALMQDVQSGEAGVQAMLAELAEKELQLGLDVDSWGDAFGGLGEGDRDPFQQMTFTLHDEQANTVNEALTLARSHATDKTLNANTNGNALAYICEFFINGQS